MSTMMPDFFDTDSSLRTHALVLCSGLAQAQEYVSVNNELLETQCVAIDVCAGVNHRNQSVSRGHWIALESDAPALALEGASTESIEFMRVPPGVVVQICQADSARWRESRQTVCVEATPETIEGDCPLESSETGRSDASVIDLIEEDHTCQYPLSGPHMTVMPLLRFDLAPGWVCHRTTPPSGAELSGVQSYEQAQPSRVSTI